ncbi:MAG: nucleotidyltransferase domain-containing protein [Candidatus Edwardsbacteria bacterium]
MLKVCNIDIEKSKEILKEVEIFAKKIKKEFHAEIYLFGSFARGEIHEGSDIDLIIVGDFKGRIFERIEEVLKLTDLPIEPLVYTPKEFQRMKKTSIFLKEVIKAGKRL